ncbi:MAG: ureidoglycolate lyase [Bacteroidia bacterium]|jgi:ureidoglycolate lyase
MSELEETILGTLEFTPKSLEEVGVYTAVIEPASDHSLGSLGFLVDDFDAVDVQIVQWPQEGHRPVLKGTGIGGGITEGDFEMHWDGELLKAHNHAVDGKYVIGWSCDPTRASEDKQREQTDFLLTFEANYHPDGGQIFYPIDNKPFIALLAEAGDDINAEDFKAYYFDGRKGVYINAGTWHQPLFPVADSQVFLDKQGAVHACIVCNFVKEFGVYIKVPLSLNQK